MNFRQLLIATLATLFLGNMVAACHTVNHLPPGQVKKIVNPPPGHGGVPPGQMKKY